MINQYMLYFYTGCFIHCLSEFPFTLVWSENISVICDGIYLYMCSVSCDGSVWEMPTHAAAQKPYSDGGPQSFISVGEMALND